MNTSEKAAFILSGMTADEAAKLEARAEASANLSQALDVVFAEHGPLIAEHFGNAAPETLMEMTAATVMSLIALYGTQSKAQMPMRTHSLIVMVSVMDVCQALIKSQGDDIVPISTEGFDKSAAGLAA